MSLRDNLRNLWPGEFKVGHKIAALCLAFALPVAILTWLYTREQNKPIASTQKELHGTEFLRSCRSLMEHVQRHRLLHGQAGGASAEPARLTAAVEQDLEDLEALDRKYGALHSQADRSTADL